MHAHAFVSLVTSSSIHRAESGLQVLGFWAERDFHRHETEKQGVCLGKITVASHTWEWIIMIGGLRRGPYAYPRCFGSAVPSVIQQNTDSDSVTLPRISPVRHTLRGDC